MKKPFFTGACTALVTPFLNGQVNYPMMQILLQRQIDAGLEAAVICGTTGESATLSDAEKLELFARCKEFVGDRMKIIAGAGSNATEHTVELSIAAQREGVDGLLVVSPYYNKGTSEGLFRHYLSIAHAVSIPVILYNVPSRTGVDIPVSVYKRLCPIPNIAGVKEATTDINKILQIRYECEDNLPIWCGNDDMTVPVMSLGGKGVISVVSNLLPQEVQAMAIAALDGDFDTAAELQCRLYSVTRLLQCQVNPVPVKAAMKCIGYDCGGCRLPLTELNEEEARKLKDYFS
ncbi:MAG: 4-hydroxy-tetrahydrodipicolinate synthase [Ruminococcaceae bacterium]|nr:4-hydroxy-tetrahydrodipicolinate synthase [Oscillospiraceae bacterium]